MSISRQLVFECKCGTQTLHYDGLFQSDNGELCVVWTCDMCNGACIAVIERIQVPKAVFTPEDDEFLKENHCYFKEDN